ncbi:HYC_CC_PP family protein [Neolewinella antarctica]|uniref:Uncharacterized protein n=1 Tax=Neolewinella antarctica TaxID=442734 RepID=A0ABX0X999_9BACT|nr:hypothetical protein [Neolewinella antarctica]NJC25840.1 hypothetical protein [Neolewinella antarctica]
MLPRLLNISLAFLVLIGSVGLPVSRHFCMGELKSVAIFGEAEKCHEEQQKAHCPFHPAPTADDSATDKKDCCSDEQDLIQIDDQEPTTATVLPPVVAIVPDFPTLLFTYRPASRLNRDKNNNFENYRPPPLLTDVVRAFQIFRI